MSSLQVYSIIGSVRRYSWGKIGSQSLVYQLADLSEREAGKPHAELWLGTHPSSPARLREPQDGVLQTLAQIVSLPLLLKVLSIGRALSIQLHPNAELAQTLHSQNPQNYPDAGAKPEMVYALTPFRALHGFRPIVELIRESEWNEVLRELLPSTGHGVAEPDFLRIVFERICQLDDAGVSRCCARLSEIYRQQSSRDMRAQCYLQLESAVIDLGSDARVDRGLLFFLLLQLKALAPGEVLVTPPGVVHAYLDGDVIECMATSDNVIRLGLTDKFVDLTSARAAVDFAPAIDSTVTKKILAPGVTDFNFTSGREFHLTICVAAEDPLVVKLPCVDRDCLMLSVSAFGQIDMEKGGVFTFEPGAAAYLSRSTSPYLLRLSSGLLTLAW